MELCYYRYSAATAFWLLGGKTSPGGFHRGQSVLLLPHKCPVDHSPENCVLQRCEGSGLYGALILRRIEGYHLCNGDIF
jgi:hypothetical protein